MPIIILVFFQIAIESRTFVCFLQAILTALDMMNGGNDWMVDID